MPDQQPKRRLVMRPPVMRPPARPQNASANGPGLPSTASAGGPAGIGRSEPPTREKSDAVIRLPPPDQQSQRRGGRYPRTKDSPPYIAAELLRVGRCFVRLVNEAKREMGYRDVPLLRQIRNAIDEAIEENE